MKKLFFVLLCGSAFGQDIREELYQKIELLPLSQLNRIHGTNFNAAMFSTTSDKQVVIARRMTRALVDKAVNAGDSNTLATYQTALNARLAPLNCLTNLHAKSLAEIQALIGTNCALYKFASSSNSQRNLGINLLTKKAHDLYKYDATNSLNALCNLINQ